MNSVSFVVMKSFLSLVFFCILFLNWQCGNSNQTTSYEMVALTEPDMSAKKTSTTQEEVKTENEQKNSFEKKIIKTGSIGIQVANYKEAKVQLNQLVKVQKGYISSEIEEKTNYRISGTIVLRVPKERFDSLIVLLVELAKNVDSKNIQVDDVTEEYVDVAARLKSKKEVEQRYTELLKQARNVSEVIEVEEKLRIIREEIESREGRLKFLDDRVDFSTITLQMYESQEYSGTVPGFFDKIGDALAGGWSGVLNFLIAMFYAWPLLIVGLVAVVGWRRIRKKNKNKIITNKNIQL